MTSDTSLASSLQNASESSVRCATYSDIPVLAALLGQSLNDDPLLQWIFQNNRQRERGVARDFGHLMKPCIKNGVVTTIGCKSVAVWMPPNPPQQTLWGRYRESLYMRYTHGCRVHQVRNCYQRMAERLPSSPHWYLLALATDGDSRGQGMATRLLEDMLDRCDREAKQVALETSNESNLAFYERFGFVVTDELLIDEGLKTWLMVR